MGDNKIDRKYSNCQAMQYTTNDELQFEEWALANNNYFSLDTIIGVAKTSNQGRIQVQIGYYLLTLPHWTSAFFGYNLFNLFNLMAIFTSLSPPVQVILEIPDEVIKYQ
ncbi:MAG: hypothetical protein BWK78_07865 [Thiotrichaceae bacterium IS1]|nr:MAG: hypothetical protein BWK78_07865 [Thiotrichaceae bacterium IS1]